MAVPRQPEPPDARRRITVVGIGADGWAGLTEPARDRIRAADILVGSARQLALVPDPAGTRITWPSPLLPALPGLLAAHAGHSLCVLASGDPMFFGIGTTLVRLLGPDRVDVLPHPSSMSLACARLGWAWEDVEVISLVGRPIDQLRRVMWPGRRILVLSADGHTPAAVAGLLTRAGYGASDLTVLAQLGGPAQQILTARADGWAHPATDPLNVVGITCRATTSKPAAGSPAPGLSLVPGLPDQAYDNDGQLTKREVRAITLARLGPRPGQLLWDVGAGAASVSIEWLRSHPSCRAIAVESDPDRAARATANAAALGVTQLRVVTGSAPAALAGLPPPHTVFIGGGATVPGMIETCWDALAPGGRLMVTAVTLESERLVTEWYDRIGGDLVRVAISRAAPIGGFTAWRPMLPVTQWTVDKG